MNGLPPVRFRVADAVVARVAELSALRVPGVVALRPGGTGAAVHGDPAHGSAEISLAVVTRLGHNCRDLAHAVQREVAAEVVAYTTLTAVVTVTIAEILLD